MATPNPLWLDAQYNNRARVADAMAQLQNWSADSALARRQALHHADLRYGAGDAETLDVFTTPRANAPVLFFIHGGYWRSLDKSDVSFVVPPFTAEGALVVVPNYALCPAVTVETIALQLSQALAWTWRHAAAYGGDPSNIVVAGHSAGGHLAAMLLCCDWQQVGRDLPAGLVQRALSISGLFDLEPLRHTPFLSADLRLTAASVPRLSPAGWAAPAGRTLYACVGGDESEEFLRQNTLIRERWGAAVVPVCEAVPQRNHFNILSEFADPTSALHAHALGLLGLR